MKCYCKKCEKMILNEKDLYKHINENDYDYHYGGYYE